MPLKDILSKPPARIPSSEDPWPKPQPSPPQATVPKTTSNICAVNDYKSSPLYSTGRPTLDEFLRTDYLMIPEFLMQVSKAKKAAGIVENKPLVENTKSSTQMGLKNVEETFSVCPTQLPEALSYARNPKEGKGVERKEVPVKYTGSSAPHIIDKLAFLDSRNRINSNEIQTPSSVVRPKQRVKKVMKGGSLVIIPAPEPKNRSLQGRQTSLEGIITETTSGITSESSGTRKNEFELLKQTFHEDSVNGKRTNEANNNYSRMKPDVRTFNQENANVPKFFPTESKQPNSENSLKDKQSVAVCKTLLVTSSEQKEGILKQTMDSEVDSGKPFCDDENRLTDLILKQRSKDDEIDPVTDENSESRMEAKVGTDTRNHSGFKSPVLNAAPKKETSNAKYKEKEHKGLEDFHSLQDNSTQFSKIEEMVKLPDDLLVVAFNQKLSNEIEREEGVESDKQQTENDNPAVVDVLENLEFTSTLQKKGEMLGQDESEKVDNNEEENKILSVLAIDSDRSSDSVSAIVVCGNEIDVKDCDSDTGNDDQDHYNDIDADENGDEVSGIDSLKGDDNAYEEEDGIVSSDNDDDKVVCSKENSGEEGGEDYAELVMDGSDSDVDEEEDDFIPGNDDYDDTTEESSDMKSDYDTEDMNLDSDTESNVGGITFYHDTTLSEKRKQLRYRKRVKRKAKNQRKNTRHKKTKIEQQGVNENKGSAIGPNCGGKAADLKNIHVHNTSSKTSICEDGTKQLVSVNQKITGTPSPNQRDTGAAQNKPSAQNSAEEGSLLSMVSSCAVDVTVAASEKLAIRRSRGGQHAKKLKKAKRKAAALERIRNGEPHPRHFAKRQAEPKLICNFYVHGKCRKGEQCPFRHVKSAVIKKKEMCKFYATGSFPCKFFHSGSKCWEAERCKFSHEPLTAETWNLLQTVLNPPPEDSIQQSEVTNPLPADTQTAAANQNTSNTNSWSEDTSPVSASSTYNFRESTRKRSLDTNEARDCHVTGEDKSSRKESPRKKDGRGSFFVPGMYKDTSV